MGFTYLQSIIDTLSDPDLFMPEEYIGCSPAEISEMESLLRPQFPLPLAYKEFLLFAGKRCPVFSDESPVYDFRRQMNLIKGEFGIQNDFFENVLTVERNAPFGFWQYSGYQYNFFELDKGDDPPVYFSSEGLDRECQEAESFSLFLKKHLHSCMEKYTGFRRGQKANIKLWDDFKASILREELYLQTLLKQNYESEIISLLLNNCQMNLSKLYSFLSTSTSVELGSSIKLVSILTDENELVQKVKSEINLQQAIGKKEEKSFPVTW